MSVTYEQVLKAAERIAPHAHVTPVLTSQTLDKLSSSCLYFKCELFQRVGAFKFRGACNAVSKILEGEKADPNSTCVVTHSSGNHAQALALAAKLHGIKSHIVMPENAPAVKRRAVEDYGAEITTCKSTQEDRERTAEEVVKSTKGVLIPPYDHPDIIAGQGTLALELVRQVKEEYGADLDAIIVPVGGGGLISGVSIAAHGLNPKIRIIGAEPAEADDAAQSLAKGERVLCPTSTTIADGLRTNLGNLTWPIIKEHVERIETVTEEEIKKAMRLVWERMKIVIEPSAAVGVAVSLKSTSYLPPNSNVAVVLCGGNIDLDAWSWA